MIAVFSRSTDCLTDNQGCLAAWVVAAAAAATRAVRMVTVAMAWIVIGHPVEITRERKARRCHFSASTEMLPYRIHLSLLWLGVGMSNGDLVFGLNNLNMIG